MKPAAFLVTCISILSIAACSTNRVGLAYSPPSTILTPSALVTPVSVGSFVDQRGETATWFGAIRGGYGNPLKVLEADPSVSVLVQRAFSDGLRARRVQNSEAAPYQISGVIKKFDCSQLVRREAHAIIDVTIVDIANGTQVFSRTYISDELEGSLMTLHAGVFANVDTLRALAEKALTEIVDKSLDDTALRNSMRRSN